MCCDHKCRHPFAEEAIGRYGRWRDMTGPAMTYDPQKTDLDAFWMPFTDNRAFKAGPRLLASAKDMHFFTTDGRAILDGTAGLWCVNAGHGRERITQAIQAQAGILDFAPTFQLAHPLAFTAAGRL